VGQVEPSQVLEALRATGALTPAVASAALAYVPGPGLFSGASALAGRCLAAVRVGREERLRVRLG
jgi:hypothetical protein